jgi:hypothetical protein
MQTNGEWYTLVFLIFPSLSFLVSHHPHLTSIRHQLQNLNLLQLLSSSLLLQLLSHLLTMMRSCLLLPPSLPPLVVLIVSPIITNLPPSLTTTCCHLPSVPDCSSDLSPLFPIPPLHDCTFPSLTASLVFFSF